MTEQNGDPSGNIEAAEAPQEEQVLRIEALSAGGDGVAHLDGKAIFLPGTVPGDRVRARLGKDKGRWARAEMLELIEPGEARITPPCPVAGQCGGCQWQQVAEPAQREARISILEEALKRITGLETWPEIKFIAGEPYAYRRRALYRGAVDPDGKLHFGFLARASHDITTHERCLLLEEPLAVAMGEFASRIENRLRPTSEFNVEATLLDGAALQLLVRCDRRSAGLFKAALDGWQPTGCGKLHLSLRGLGEARIFEEAKGAPFLLEQGSIPGDGEKTDYSLYTRPGEFIQANTAASRRLVASVLEHADPEQDSWLLDLYCGAGNFCLPLALKGARVLGVERQRNALRSARKAARGAGIARARFRAGDVAEVLAGLVQEDRHYHTVVLDPPRAGAPELQEFLVPLGVERIVSVSCHAASFARDLKGWLACGFKLDALELHDLFPQTHHSEVLASLSRQA